MAKRQTQVDVLVLGEHPAAFLTAALLRHKTKLRIVHSTIPGENLADRLVMVNPKLYSLHPLLEGLKRKLSGQGVYGLRFLTDDPAVCSEYRSKSGVGTVVALRDIRTAMENLAQSQEVEFVRPDHIQVNSLDEQGIDLKLGNTSFRARVLALGGTLDEQQYRTLGIPLSWEQGIVHRYSYVRLKGARLGEGGSRPLMCMSLDLRQTLSWGWVFPGLRGVQLAVEQSSQSLRQAKPLEMLEHWLGMLQAHGMLRSAKLTPELVESVDLPLAGALAHEGLANRTVLLGPAGGFYSANCEDPYPNCWSAIYAADALKKALREVHLQDALQIYRHKWRTTLGDYLRGPKPNLRFLLPLVYRNQVMTDRLAEAILLGKSVIR